MTAIETSSVSALKILAENMGFDLVKRNAILSKPKTITTLELGKNRSERGHTVRYNQLNRIFEYFEMRSRCIEGAHVLITTLDGAQLIFSLNKNEKAYCGTTSGGLNFENRATVYVSSIKLLN